MNGKQVRIVAGIAGVAAPVAASALAVARSVSASRREIDRLQRALASAEADARRVADDLVDPETGLLDSRYFTAALEQRVAAARRKLQPLAVMLVDVDTEHGSVLTFTEQAAVIRDTLREADSICRVGVSRLGLILEEATEFGAVFAIERIRMSVNDAGGDEEHLWAGVAGYTSHALDAPQLLDRAAAALERARSSGRGWVRVARASE